MVRYIAKIGKNCVACGACMNICPRQAITIIDGIKAKVDQEKCVGCGLCVNTCPAAIISKVAREQG
ncbi:MAG: 4Fe-4S binding protein [Erysipelotrichaceae bacterium]|nr:4Fe-4S binding protein [Erysipelotrichaceae bacterium]MDY5252177.1 4Fe-4S binding protein [Erysipelotrichaceae bacterium]